MTDVQRSSTYAVTAAEMWNRIGDFQGLDTWHPGIASCTASEGGAVRDLTLGDGNHVVERRAGETEHSYTYDIIDPGPLPVADYQATIAVRDGEDGGCVVDWRAHFTPHGAPEADAVAVIANVFESGLGAL